MLKPVPFLFLAAALLSLPVHAQTPGMKAQPDTRISAPDKQFLTEAAKGGNTEVALGQMALTQSSSQAIKDYGRMLMNEHSQLNVQVLGTASAKGVMLGREMDSAKTAQLQGLTGDSFDQKFIAMAIKDHEKDIADFQKAAQGAEDPAVRKTAATALPILQRHLAEAQRIQEELNAAHKGKKQQKKTPME